MEWLNERKQIEFGYFDHVIVCSGIFSRTFTPEITGLKTFPGPILHSHDYKTPLPFTGKTVAIIGNAFSGSEIAAEVAQTAEKVINVIRQPMWILPRYLQSSQSESKLPNDLIFYSRAAQARSLGVDPMLLNERKNLWFKSLCSKQADICQELELTTPLSAPPFVTISDAYLAKIEVGKISVKRGEIDHTHGNKLFITETDHIEADAIIFCTEYRVDIPFFDATSQSALEFHSDDPLQPLLLHHTVFHPHFPNLAFVGMYRGPFFGVIELQARMACLTFSGRIPYPTDAQMKEGIETERAIRQMIPRPQFPHGDYVRFSDHLAKQIGVLPDLSRLEQEDPTLYEQLFRGPFTSASFRLSGFGSKPDIALKIIQEIHSISSTN